MIGAIEESEEMDKIYLSTGWDLVSFAEIQEVAITIMQVNEHQGVVIDWKIVIKSMSMKMNIFEDNFVTSRFVIKTAENSLCSV